MKTVHAVFEKGMFRPLEAVELPERREVEFEPRPVHPPGESGDSLSSTLAKTVERLATRVEDLEDPRDLQAAIAENGNEPLIPWEQAKAGLDID